MTTSGLNHQPQLFRVRGGILDLFDYAPISNTCNYQTSPFTLPRFLRPRFKLSPSFSVITTRSSFVPKCKQTKLSSLVSLRPLIKHLGDTLIHSSADAMASAFSAIKTMNQPLHRTTNNPFSKPTSPFLGSGREFRPVPSSAPVRRQSTIVAVSSDVVKKKKTNSIPFSSSDLVSISF